jgi:hypothetical protein
MAVTEEGACYALFADSAAHRYWALTVVTSILPVVTGAMLGMRTQLLGFSSVFDEDAGERTENTATSDRGLPRHGHHLLVAHARARRSRTSAPRSTTRRSAPLRELLFKRNQPG